MTTDPLTPANAPRADAHLRDAHELAQAYQVNPATGLHDEEATQRALQHGANELQDHARRGPLALLADQFKDFMVLVLLGAAVISGVIGDLTDTLVILVIVVLNAIIGFVQAWRADQAMAALRQLSAAHATVLRGGEVQVVPASVLVPGDIVLLEAGNQIPADLRLIEIAQLQVDESALTGESVTVAKQTDTLAAQDTSALGDRVNMAFKGTTATHGRARGLVVATGMHTELGKVARLLGGEDRSTPLQLRLAAFGKRLALGVIAICIVIFAVGVLRGESPLLMALTAISLAVAAIPEALPAVVTVLLALGARRMVAVKALVRRLPSVETLGSVTTICSDKTGTLTQNHMHAELLLAQGQRWAPGDPLPGPVHAEALRAAALCNDAARHARSDDDGAPISPSPCANPTDWQGDPTETALVLAAHAGGLDKAQLDVTTPRVQEQPFDSDRKRMTTFHRCGNGGSGFVAYTKGAPESVLPRCTAQWTPEGGQPLDTAAVLATANQLAAQGLRVLALARRNHARLPDTNALDDVESQLELLGLIALIDPPRPEAQAAVRDCMSAGITPVMITGDHPATARAIAHRLGIVAHADAPVLTGADLAQLDDAALRARVEQVHVYARVDPAQKIRIVEALQAQGHFVAMTGDGVNDAPALKRADIGVSMGKGGTDVAREASSLVLLDDNFATIVAAVKEGRRIYDNIRKFVRYAMTGNSGEIWTIFPGPAAAAAHSAAAHPHPVGQPGDRRPARPGPGGRARRARHHAAPAPPAEREPVCPGHVAAHPGHGPADRWPVPGRAGLGLAHRPRALADHGVHRAHACADGPCDGHPLRKRAAVASGAGQQPAPAGRRAADVCAANGHHLRAVSQPHFQNRAAEPGRAGHLRGSGAGGVLRGRAGEGVAAQTPGQRQRHRRPRPIST
jgi:Ca2+-transporting ATPase